MAHDGVREEHGVGYADGTYKVSLYETPDGIAVSVRHGARISANEARYLAGRLRRLATRVERNREG